MYYGYPSASDMAHPQQAWDGSFAGVWHLDENAVDGTQTTTHYDSTANGYNGKQNNNSQVAGKIGYAQSFNGVNDWINVSTHPVPTTQLTMAAWVYLPALNGNAKIVGDFNRVSVGNPFYGYQIGVGTAGNNEGMYSEINDNTATNYMMKQGSLPLNTWTYLANNWTTGGQFGGYVNASHYSMAASANNIGNLAGPLRIGAPGWQVNGLLFNGRIDEVHISTTARSPDWIRTEYNNQNTPSLFHKVGAEESFVCGGGSAPAYVQSKSQSYGATNQASITLPGSSASTDLLVLSFIYDNTALTVSSVTDSKGNTYTSAVGPTTVGGWGKAYTYYAKNIVGGAGAITTTITLSGPSTSLFDAYLLEYSGLDATAPLDQTSSGTGSGTAMDSGSKTTTKAPELIYGFGADDNDCTVDSPYTNREATNGQCAGDQTVFSTGLYHVTATENPTGAWLLQMATFKGA